MPKEEGESAKHYHIRVHSVWRVVGGVRVTLLCRDFSPPYKKTLLTEGFLCQKKERAPKFTKRK